MDSTTKGRCSAEPSPARQPGEPARLDLEAVRERLRTKKGPEFWRSLDELAAAPEFSEMLHREFPRHASEWTDSADGVSRRSCLQLAGASLALAGLTACTRQPTETIVPYVKQPEQLVPGKPLFFATALTVGGYATGVLAESHQGRPTKIEGNPDHPASLGATDVFAQAAVLSLYDPERSQTILHSGRPATWSGFVSEASGALRALQALGGDGLRILTGTVTSPTLAAQIQDLLKTYPKARWHRWDAAAPTHSYTAVVRAFGRPLAVRYDLAPAKVVLSLGADLLAEGPGAVRYARQFADGRRVRKANLQTPQMNRLYAVESFPTASGTIADHRLQLSPPQMEAFALALAQAVGAGGTGTALADPKAQKWLQAVAADLKANAGASLVVADEYGSPALQVLAHAINQALGNAGRTVVYSEPVEVDPVDPVQSLGELAADMNAGKVDVLLMLDGVNPVYSAPADVPFAEGLKKVRVAIHHGLHEDETSGYCGWHLNAAHELEAWGDARAFDGTFSIIQPLIEPLYGGKTASEVLAALAGKPDSTSYDLVRETWSTRLAGAGLPQTTDPGGVTTSLGFGTLPGTMQQPAPATTGSTGPGNAAAAFDAGFRRVLLAGLVAGTQAPPVSAALLGAAVTQAANEITAAGSKPGQLTLLFRPDPTVRDGSLASNAWLQELPKPISKLTWDNALMLSPRTAQRLKLEMEEMAEVTVANRKIRAAVWIQPGVADDTALLHLGYGRENAGKATGAGFNAYPLRTSQALWSISGVELRGLGERYPLASTQNHHLLDPGWSEMELASREAERREVIRHGTLEQYRRNPNFIAEAREKPADDESMFARHPYPGHAWGMSIDLSVCTGCSSCVVACQSENNIPVVGKEQVLKHRAMHWLRIDRYFSGDIVAPTVHHQPVPCMQCENAPCEVVCPVAATVHSDEGLNDMVYNRCVGTRYCSNNCPYKVRRFNFLRYSDRTTPVLALLENPDVTVRMRGVMEKCTYCVQRIEEAKIESKVEGRPIPTNWLKTACQQSCPTQAIVFGDINDPASEVTKLKAEPLNYGLLEELNTRPRTTYLAKLRNPNPGLEGAEGT
ncbi:MAG TPA: TAT-variant-translocated molybdopterin oxidoreductase [Thermoanaerobaculia bacterium]|nr:TAT-variant-translocated molybdopterin oxidoreductase [Thermoanaerobaculia bacterium]